MTNEPERLRQFKQLSAAFCAHTGKASSTLSRLLFNDGGRINDLTVGSDVGVRRLEAAVRDLSHMWPADLAWPSDIPRPQPGSPVFAHGNGNAAVAAPDAGEAA